MFCFHLGNFVNKNFLKEAINVEVSYLNLIAS